MLDITREEIIQASWDVRLELTPEEMEELEKQVMNLFRQADFLADVALDDLEPSSFPLVQENAVRDDTPAPSLSRETVLSNAPEVESVYIQVPRIVE
ncbi:MAG TPA: Asp-tRNA(Asn)/Glu-tRNA(Gln) amidotransferase subunit GatC [Firmicutes bacterium]|nr:Asp-tRNA(Asn)/Glu-tRNA(Gln) amidotransferase subunit GatC [Bacillota bacterium]